MNQSKEIEEILQSLSAVYDEVANPQGTVIEAGFTLLGKKQATKSIEQLLLRARVEELKETSNKLVKLGVPVMDYDSKNGYSKVGQMFADRITDLERQLK